MSCISQGARGDPGRPGRPGEQGEEGPPGIYDERVLDGGKGAEGLQGPLGEWNRLDIKLLSYHEIDILSMVLRRSNR